MNILAIGAHYDDIELGCGGSICQLKNDEHNVYMVVVTDSDYISYDGTILRTKNQAQSEGQNAASILGIEFSNLFCLGLETKKVQYNQKLIEDLNYIIDKHHIDTIFTHWQYDVHQDHSAIGRATLNAGRHCPRILTYRSNWYKTSHIFNDNFYIDISNVISKKIESIKAHLTEFNRRGQSWIDFTIHHNQNNGMEIGTGYAEVFEIVKWLY